MPRTCLLSSILKKTFPVICLLILAIPVTSDFWAGLSPLKQEQVMSIIGRVESAYAQIEEYQTETEVSVYREGQIVETERFLYTFKKPDHVRIDMESPHAGTILVYPDTDGKVSVKPGGWAGFLKFHLAPGSTLLRNSAGQQIDQTDLGLLIRNIVHSITDRRHGEIYISEQDGRVLIVVLAEDHFLAGVLTLYLFSIDKTRWLPVEVKESTPDGILKRKVIFRNLNTSVVVPDSFFRIDGGSSGNGQIGR
jgi:outer membrane lipoprotein-sorting protein